MWIGLRDQQPDLAGTGIIESMVEIRWIWANVLPIGAMTFYQASQTDTPVTHRVWTRWLGYVDTKHIVLRDIALPDSGRRRELFRIRRVAEDAGRKRYTMLEVELEGTG